MDSGLKREIEEKVLSGSRLSFDDGMALYGTDEVAWLGELAHEVRTRRFSDKATFAVTDGGPQVAEIPGEEPRHWVEHLLRLREQQDETGDLQVFVPGRHQQDSGRSAPTGVEALKMFAVSRLLLDNVDHVTCSLAAHGVATSQLALHYGADDLEASAETTRDDLVDLIRDSGFTPVERDGRYEVVAEYEGPDPMLREEPQLMTF
ncbi:MAG: hypothetical protein HOV87_36200 [Catenulispora sp.]|nr:hypothetical protein [Catenulispora sp.]